MNVAEIKRWVADNFIDRGDQINLACKWVLDNDAHYTMLKNMPNRLTAAALVCFKNKNDGYAANIVRKALKTLDKEGQINTALKPFDHDQLYGSN